MEEELNRRYQIKSLLDHGRLNVDSVNLVGS